MKKSIDIINEFTGAGSMGATDMPPLGVATSSQNPPRRSSKRKKRSFKNGGVRRYTGSYKSKASSMVDSLLNEEDDNDEAVIPEEAPELDTFATEEELYFSHDADELPEVIDADGDGDAENVMNPSGVLDRILGSRRNPVVPEVPLSTIDELPIESEEVISDTGLDAEGDDAGIGDIEADMERDLSADVNLTPGSTDSDVAGVQKSVMNLLKIPGVGAMESVGAGVGLGDGQAMPPPKTEKQHQIDENLINTFRNFMG